MSIRFASLTQRISANGQALHAAMMNRIQSEGADHEPSEDERALLEERKILQQAQQARRARAGQPKPAAADRLVRTHHPEAKARPEGTKPGKEAKPGAQKAKPHRSRAEKHAEKAAARDAARRAPRKPAKEK